MSEFIPLRHIDRIFPFQFYKELNEVFTQYIPQNPAFTLQYTKHHELITDLTQKNIFDQYHHDIKLQRKKQNENNLSTISGLPLLHLYPFVSKDNINENTGQILSNNTAVLMVQYYDINQQPIFTKNSNLSFIRKIPEILYDDPNLALYILTIPDDSNESSQLGVLKQPTFLDNQMLQNTEQKGENNDNI